MLHAAFGDLGISCFGFDASFIASTTRKTNTRTRARPSNPSSREPLASPHAATGTPTMRQATAAQMRGFIGSGRLLHWCEGLGVTHLERGRDPAGAAVLELDHRVDVLLLPARVHRIHQRVVLVLDEPAPH